SMTIQNNSEQTLQIVWKLKKRVPKTVNGIFQRISGHSENLNLGIRVTNAPYAYNTQDSLH
ncbi:MAG: hypothetical protein ACLU6V_09195, partial [Lancefieldella rimae]